MCFSHYHTSCLSLLQSQVKGNNKTCPSCITLARIISGMPTLRWGNFAWVLTGLLYHPITMSCFANERLWPAHTPPIIFPFLPPLLSPCSDNDGDYLLKLREVGTGKAWGLNNARKCSGGELYAEEGSRSKQREIDSLILPLGLILWLIRTCK